MRSHHLRVGASTSPFSFDDAAYSDFFTSNAQPINVSNSSSDKATFSNQNTSGHSYLTYGSAFLDHDADEIVINYGLNGRPSYFTWNNGGNTYTGNANFYAVNSGPTQFALGNPPVIAGNKAGDITVAYLQDNTPVYVVSHTNDEHLYFFYYSNKNYIGKLKLSSSNSGMATNSYMAGVCFSGTHIIVYDLINRYYLWGYDLPANTSAINGGTINHSLRWASPSATPSGRFGGNYGMVYGGGNRVYITGGTDSLHTTQYLLSDNGNNGTSSVVSVYTANRGDSGNSTPYNVAMDYKNRTLVVGGSKFYNVFEE